MLVVVACPDICDTLPGTSPFALMMIEQGRWNFGKL